MSINIQSEKEFNEIITKNKLVIVDFWAEWCGPCRVQAPILETLEKNNPGNVIIAKVNVDENEKLSQDYRIASIPTLLVFSEGKQFGTPIIGVTGLPHLQNIVSNFKN